MTDAVSVKTSLTGLEQLRTVVERTLRAGGNLQGVAEVVAEELVAAVEQNFQDERGFEQGPWKELEDSTTSRRREAASHKILQDTGNLAGSIQPAHEGLDAEAYTEVPYAVFHVSDEPRKIIPLRDFLDVDLDSIANTTSDIILAEFQAG